MINNSNTQQNSVTTTTTTTTNQQQQQPWMNMPITLRTNQILFENRDVQRAGKFFFVWFINYLINVCVLLKVG